MEMPIYEQFVCSRLRLYFFKNLIRKFHRSQTVTLLNNFQLKIIRNKMSIDHLWICLHLHVKLYSTLRNKSKCIDGKLLKEKIPDQA